MENENIEQLHGVDVHPKVIEAIDQHGMTALNGLILHYLTDPETEYNNGAIAGICQQTLGQGSKRSVRRVKTDYEELVKEILLLRELEVMGDDFTTEEAPEKNAPEKGNGEDKEATAMESQDGFWDVTEELDCVTACSKAPQKTYVFMSSVARKKINLFMKWAGSQEWLAYLVGEFIDEKTVNVMDITLPNQNANSTLVSKVICEDYNKLSIVGVIHSHHDMGHGSAENPGFSGHDNEFINSNHNVSLLVAKKGIAGHVRTKTPCGAFIKVNATIKQMDEVTVDEKKLKAEFKEKINFGRGRGGHHESYSVTLGGDNVTGIDDLNNKIVNGKNYHF